MNNKITVRYIRQPAFYKDFHCIGSECPVNCCFDWGIIGWTKEEYEKLKNANMSKALSEKFEASFKHNTNEQYLKAFDYMIEYDKSKKCPLLTENGLCLIQKELGEEYLSHTCRAYPRKGRVCGDTFIRTCQSSCLHVLKLICSDANSMLLENIQNIRSINERYSGYTITEKINHPVVKFEKEIFDFFYELLSDRTHSIETSIVLGGMACQKIDEFVKKGQHDCIPEILKVLKPQINNSNQIEKLEKIKPNLSLKANYAAGLLKFLKGSDIYQSVFTNELPSEEKWCKGQSKFNDFFKSNPSAICNIALNLYITNRMPFNDINFSVFDNYCYFTAEVAIVKFLAVVAAVSYECVDEAFYAFAAYIDRIFTHNPISIKYVIDYTKKFGIKSPAYLMGILR